MGNPRCLAGHAGVQEVVQISSPDTSKYSTGLDQMRVAYIARRCDLARPLAAVVADLAMGGAHV